MSARDRRLKKVQQCTAMTSKGERCSKYCAPGELVCAKHAPDAAPVGIIATQSPMDAMAELRRLMKDRDSRVRLRAVNAYLVRLEKEKRGCLRCAATAEKDRLSAEFVERATPEQCDEVRRLIQAINTIRAEVLSSGALRVEENSRHATEQQDHQPPREAASAPVTPDQHARAEADEARDDEVVRVWRDGALVEEPRSARPWKEVRS